MEAPKYEPAVIQEFAWRLYRRAATLVIYYALIGSVLGLVGGAAVGAGLGSALGVAIGGGILMGGLFAAIATDRAFALRLQAQTALCQLQIELNTRPR